MTSFRTARATALLALAAMLGTVGLICAGCAVIGPDTRPTPDASAGADTSAGTAASSGGDSSDESGSAPVGAYGGGLTVVTIGDSIMAGYGLDGEDEAWPALLASATGDDVVNLGCSGAGFVVDGDCGTNFAGLIADAVNASPDVVIVQSSDNDMYETREDIVDDTNAMLSALREALPHARIVALNTLWNQSWDAPEAIAWSTDALRGAVRDVGGTFVWIGQPLQDQTDLLQWDEEHPTIEGQQTLYRTIAGALEDADIRL